MTAIYRSETANSFSVKIAPVVSKRYDTILPSQLKGIIEATEYAHSIRRCNEALDLPRSQKIRLGILLFIKVIPFFLWLPIGPDGQPYIHDMRYMYPGLATELVLITCLATYWKYVSHLRDIRFFSAVHEEHQYYLQRCCEFDLPAIISWSVNISPSSWWWLMTRLEEKIVDTTTDPTTATTTTTTTTKQREKGTRSTQYRILIEVVVRNGRNNNNEILFSSSKKNHHSDLETSYSFLPSRNTYDNNNVLIEMPLISQAKNQSI